MELFDKFIDFPEEYILIEELYKYTAQIIIPVGAKLQSYSCGFPVDPKYPITGLMVEFIDLVLECMEKLSPSFVKHMACKHR